MSERRLTGKLSVTIDRITQDEMIVMADREKNSLSRVVDRLLRRGIEAEKQDKMAVMKCALKEISLLGDVDCDIAPQLAREALDD